MGLIGPTGQPLKTRQQQREEARKMQNQVVVSGKTVEKIMSTIDFLLYRTDIIFGLFKSMGITQEQFDQVEANVKAEATEIRVRMGTQQAGGEQ